MNIGKVAEQRTFFALYVFENQQYKIFDKILSTKYFVH